MTGRPRTPRDQRSVENANKLVKQVLMSLSRERRMQGIETNWTKILGQVMLVCNSHSGIRRYSTSSYQAVFGQPYHPELWCTVAELRECKTIGQRLNLSPDDRLATYVREHDIVDYISNLGGGGVSSLASDGDDADMNGDDEEEGLDLSDDGCPDALSHDNADNDGAEFPSLPGIDLSHDDADDDGAEFPSLPGIDFSTTTPSVEAHGSPAITQDHDRTASKTEMNQSEDIVSLSSTASTKDHGDGQNVNWSYTRAAEYSTLMVAEAWEHGNIARKQSSLGDNRRYNFLWPTLSCEDCCHPHGCFQLQVGDDGYTDRISNTTDWYDGTFISSFAQLAAHYAHSTVAQPELGPTYPDVLPQLIHVTYPRGEVRVDQCCALRTDTTTVVAVLHDSDHDGVLEIDIKKRLIHIYDGLNRNLDRWFVFIFYALKRCMLCPLSASPKPVPDKAVTVKRHGQSSRSAMKSQKSIEGYQIEIGSSPWRYERGSFIRQVDAFNCGPVACVKILEMFALATHVDLESGYQMGRLRLVVKQYMERFVSRLNSDLIIQVRELRQACATESMATSSQAATVISAAATASEKAEIDPNYLCSLCYCDAPHMDVLRLTCCQNTVHRQCFIAQLMNFITQCPYCRAVVDDIAPVLDLPSIDRSSTIVEVGTMEPPNKGDVRLTNSPTGQVTTTPAPVVKRNLEEMLVIAEEDKTPLRTV